MEASTGSAFLSFLTVLELLGLKISWFPIRVGETDVATNVGLPQIALDLGSEEEESFCFSFAYSDSSSFVKHNFFLFCRTVLR